MKDLSKTKRELILEIEEMRNKLQKIKTEGPDKEIYRKIEEYNAFMESSQDHIFYIDKNLRITFVNKKAASSFNSEPEKITGKHIREIFPPEVAEHQIKNLSHVFNTGETISVVSGSEFPGGKVWLNTSLVPVRNQDGEVTSVMGASRDVTEQKNTETELRRSEEKFRDLYDSSPDMYCSVSPQTAEIIECNRTLIEATGYLKEELIGKPVFEMYDPSILNEVQVAFNQFRAKGIVRNKELLLKRKDGTNINVSLNVNSIRDKNGNIIHSMSAWRDITEQVNLRREIEKSEEKFRNLFNSVSIPLCYVKENGVIESFNSRFTQLFGYNSSDIPTLKEWWILAYPEKEYRTWVVDNWNNAVQKSIEQGTDIKSDCYNVTCKNGDVRQIIIAGITIGTDFLATFIDITEQRKAEELIVREKEFSESVIDTMPGIFYLFDKNGKFLRWNRTLADLSGHTFESISGKSPFDFVAGKDHEKVKEAINTAFSEGEVYVEAEFMKKDGTGVPFYFTGKRIFLNKEPLLLGVGIDITRRKKAEEKLKKSEASMRLIFDSMPFGTMIIGRDKKIRSLNESALKLMGYTSFNQIEGKYCNETMCPSDKCECPILDLHMSVDKSERILLTRDRKEVPILKSVLPVTIDNEDVLLETFVDISDLKQLEKEREYAFEERDRFFKVSLDLLCIAGTDGYFRRLNPAWTDLLGYTQEELKSSPFFDFIHPDDVEPTMKEVAKLAEGNNTISFLNRYRCSNGTYKWLKWNSVPYGDILYAAATDVTKLKESEEKLIRIASDLRKSNEELEQFAYVASHDLQEPLRMVASFTQLLEMRYKDQLDEKANNYIHFAVDGAKRMQLLINDLLDFSRISTKGETMKEISFEKAINKALNSLKLLTEETNASITHDALPVLKADSTQIERLFQNLIGNALKFRKEDSHPEIHISAVAMNDRWKFSVSDNGIGIPEEYKEKVFIIFQRLHGKDKYPGTGIGLAICKRIVNRHGGDIWFNSDPGKGTTFYFTIKK